MLEKDKSYSKEEVEAQMSLFKIEDGVKIYIDSEFSEMAIINEKGIVVIHVRADCGQNVGYFDVLELN